MGPCACPPTPPPPTPTVAPLADEGWIAIEVIIDERVVRRRVARQEGGRRQHLPRGAEAALHRVVGDERLLQVADRVLNRALGGRRTPASRSRSSAGSFVVLSPSGSPSSPSDGRETKRPLSRSANSPAVTRVCLVGDPEVNLQYELLSRETSREALATYDGLGAAAELAVAEQVGDDLEEDQKIGHENERGKNQPDEIPKIAHYQPFKVKRK